MTQTKSNHLDQVALVDEKDNLLGTMDKIEAHRGSGQLHRAISVYLFNDQDQLLIQRRSHKKIVGAKQWANTVCGNVRPNETYQECAYRRLREELGITQAKIQPIYKFQYQLKCNDQFSEHELDQVFVGFYQGEVKPNPDEVSDYAWEELNLAQLVNKYDLAPWFELMLNDWQLQQKLQGFLSN
ncbi:MAG: isopentenyl-diphosphate Delta-isomerase [Candidatus Pacebacteria bacterium]|nr:isopentenyl-diphosphate Delta-isomerase [Candidatus Paceibacterota bacterium]